MMFLELDLAVYKRLTGYPLDTQGRPKLADDGRPINREVIGPPGMYQFEKVYDPINKTYVPVYPTLPSYGIRIPQFKAPYRGQKGQSTFNPEALSINNIEPNVFKQIPVFDQNVTNRDFEKYWPCVTFRWSSIAAQPNTYIYDDPFGGPDPSASPIDIKNQYGDIIASGVTSNLRRPVPDSWDVLYTITVHSKESIEMSLMCAEVLKLFPMKGAITVTFMDGTTHTCNMLFQRSIVQDLDNIGMAGEENQRSFTRAFVYLIEAYFDNTSNKFGIQDSAFATTSYPTIVERIFELDSIMGNLAASQQTADFNQFDIVVNTNTA
jgi:hypothetical protein